MPHIVKRTVSKTVYRNELVLGRWKLIPNAVDVFKYGWTIRWNLVAVIFAGLEFLLPWIDQNYVVPIPRPIFGILSMLTIMISTAARFMVQPKLSQPPVTPLPEALKPYADKHDPILPQG